MARLMNQQINALSSRPWGTTLSDPKHDFPELAKDVGAVVCTLSKEMRLAGTEVGSSDMVFVNFDRTSMVVVVACVDFEYALGLRNGVAWIVRECRKHSGDDLTSIWDLADEPSVYHLSERQPIIKAKFWRWLSPKQFEVLH